MRYGSARKQETRRSVVRAAAAAMRVKGPDGVSVAEIMAEAGLTHGGFYAHFPSKQALIAEAVEEAFGQSRRRFARMTEGMTPRDALASFIDGYLCADHRDNPQRGCPISTLVNDLPRQSQGVRDAFDAGVEISVARLEAWLPGQDPAARRGLASSILAEMAGAMALARAVSDDDRAEQLLAASRTGIRARLGLPTTGSAALSKGA
jgi:TetR/AcrR family transcriptional regulator, transcriptional repressor for nem operon